MKILKFFGISFLSLVILIACLIFGANIYSKWRYQQDVQQLFEVAKQLGYVEENQMNFYRSQGSFPSSNQDMTQLAFTTTDSLDTFSAKIDTLDLKLDPSYPMINGKESVETTYIPLINKAYSSRLIIANSSTEYSEGILSKEISPRVTKWIFLPSNSKNKRVSLNIDFAQLPSKSLLWKDTESQKTASGPLVVISMDR